MKTLLYTILFLFSSITPCHTAGVYDSHGKFIGRTTWKKGKEGKEQ